jgi:hypothetical protein
VATTVIHIKDAPPGWRSNPQYRYIGRGSPVGNPFRIGDPHPSTGQLMNRNMVCNLFQEQVLPLISRNAIRDLRNKTLVCFCKPHRCHGDSLATAADNHIMKSK